MNAKQRYRLRTKFQAALLRLDEVLNLMEKHTVNANEANTMMTEWMMLRLRKFLDQGPIDAKSLDENTAAFKYLMARKQASMRRQLATAHRQIRREAARLAKSPQHRKLMVAKASEGLAKHLQAERAKLKVTDAKFAAYKRRGKSGDQSKPRSGLQP